MFGVIAGLLAILFGAAVVLAEIVGEGQGRADFQEGGEHFLVAEEIALRRGDLRIGDAAHGCGEDVAHGKAHSMRHCVNNQPQHRQNNGYAECVFL